MDCGPVSAGTENWQTPEKLLVEGLLSAPDANKQQRKHPVVLQQLLQELPLPRKMPIHFQVGSAAPTCVLCATVCCFDS